MLTLIGKKIYEKDLKFIHYGATTATRTGRKFPSTEEPSLLKKELNNIPGVVENGIFSGVTDQVVVATAEGVTPFK